MLVVRHGLFKLILEKSSILTQVNLCVRLDLEGTFSIFNSGLIRLVGQIKISYWSCNENRSLKCDHIKRIKC